MGSGSYNFVDANRRCQEEFGAFLVGLGRNATLATIETAAQADTVVSVLQSAGIAEGHAVWFGATDQVAEGVWRFVERNQTMQLYDADPGKDIKFSRWGGSEPNDWGGSEHCGEMRWHGSGLNWNDDQCGGMVRFLCSVRLTDETTTTTTTTTIFPLVVPPGGFPSASTATCRCPSGKELVVPPATAAGTAVEAYCREIDDCVGNPCGPATYGVPHTCNDLSNTHSCSCAPAHEIQIVSLWHNPGDPPGTNQTCVAVDYCYVQVEERETCCVLVWEWNSSWGQGVCVCRGRGIDELRCEDVPTSYATERDQRAAARCFSNELWGGICQRAMEEGVTTTTAFRLESTK